MYKLSIVYTTTNLPQFLFSERDREGGLDWKFEKTSQNNIKMSVVFARVLFPISKGVRKK
jgi:hypothetical protein